MIKQIVAAAGMDVTAEVEDLAMSSARVAETGTVRAKRIDISDGVGVLGVTVIAIHEIIVETIVELTVEMIIATGVGTETAMAPAKATETAATTGGHDSRYTS